MRFTYTIFDAKAYLSRLLKQVEEGHEVIIRRGGNGRPWVPVARVIPYTEGQESDGSSSILARRLTDAAMREK